MKLTLYDDAPAPPGWPDYFGHASTIPAYAAWQRMTNLHPSWPCNGSSGSFQDYFKIL